MSTLAALALVGALVALGVAVLALVYSRRSFQRMVRSDMADLESVARAQAPRLVSLDPEVLPEPVHRYLRFARVEGRPWIAHVRLRQQGEIRTSFEEPWVPARAQQVYGTEPPGMVWSADIRMPPGLPVRIRDRYYAGRGEMYARLGYFMTVVDATGDAIDTGALVRFLAEAPWFPSLLAASERLKWEAIDDRSAAATLLDGEIEARVVFHFGPDGSVTRVEADRDRAIGQSVSRERWTGLFRDYENVHGWVVPTAGEAIWNLAEGDFSYYRFTVSDVEYFAPRPDEGLAADSQLTHRSGAARG
jgi:hypothetical protein